MDQHDTYSKFLKWFHELLFNMVWYGQTSSNHNSEITISFKVIKLFTQCGSKTEWLREELTTLKADIS